MICNNFKEKENESNIRKVGTPDNESAVASCSKQHMTKSKKTKKRKKANDTDDNSSSALSDIDSSESDNAEIPKKRKTDLSACFLLER